MKRFINFLVLAAAALAWVSCNNGNKEEGTDEPETGSGYYEFPLECQEEGFTAGDNGVTINVSDIKEKNIVFNLVPGKAVKSYRMTVYPKAMLYNLLLNEGLVEGTQEQCEASIIELLSASTLFNKNSDNFAVKEFDWVNSAYATAPIIPDCEYFIIALAYYDEDGLNPSSLSISHLTTPSKELIGDPQIGIDVETGYSAFIVRYHPNEDCKYFAHWVWTTKEIKEYIDLFGEKLMGDFCRSAYSDVLDATVEENLAVKMTFDASLLDRKNTAIAVALDANHTPSKVIMRNDFELQEIPEGDFKPVAKVEAGNRIGATIAYFDVEMEKNCMSCFYRLYTAEQAAQLKAASKEVQAAEALSIANEGWGVANTRFSFDTDLEKLTGDAFKSTEVEHQAELKPDTEYVLGYVAKNYFQDGAILAPCAMKHRNDHIHRDLLHTAIYDLQEAFFCSIGRKGGRCAEFFPFPCFHMLHRAIIDQPFPFFGDTHRKDLIFFFIQCIQHQHRRGSGNLMLRGLSAKNHCNGYFTVHNILPFKRGDRFNQFFSIICTSPLDDNKKLWKSVIFQYLSRKKALKTELFLIYRNM